MLFENIRKVEYKISLICLLFVLCVGASVHAARFRWESYDDKSDEWFKGEQARTIAQNILSWQDQYGSWPKNLDTSSERYDGEKADLDGTFDNRATTDEMRYLARIYNVTNVTEYKDAFIKGFDLILKAQYPTGGWPQHYPAGKGYARYITFNDGVMVLLMMLLDDIVKSDEFDFVDASHRKVARDAFDKGLDCILKCQVKVNGELTVWCAQHDEIDYSPRPARSFELESLSGGESAGILYLLMSVEKPSKEIVKAITSGVQWYKKSMIKGVCAYKEDGKFLAKKDPNAEPVWARFYEIETNRPFFCNRDGIRLYDHSQLDQERSMGYKWYGDWGKGVIKEYEKWALKYENLLVPEGTKVMVIIGDSTVCEYKENDVRRGWGHFIQGYFDDSIKVMNLALSGRSTKTFIEQGHWQKVIDIKPDYVLIQFGHNDSHELGRPESTDASTSYKDYLRKYIDESRQFGAKPVLVTPMYRRKFDDSGTKIKDNLLPYANAMKEVATEKNVPLVDLNSMSEKLYLELGPEKVLEHANKPGDQTHFNKKGAAHMAELVMGKLPIVEPSLKTHLKSVD